MSIFKDERFEKNEIVKILNGTAKNGRNGGIEIHVGGFSKIDLAPEDVDYKKYPKIKEQFVKIQDINENLGVEKIILLDLYKVGQKLGGIPQLYQEIRDIPCIIMQQKRSYMSSFSAAFFETINMKDILNSTDYHYIFHI